MQITRYFLLLFITVSLFAFTFSGTDGGYWFFVQTFPVVLTLTGVVFIDELFNPSKKKKYINSDHQLQDEIGMKGLIYTFALLTAIVILFLFYRNNPSVLIQGVLLIVFFVFAYVLYKVFDWATYKNMTFSVKQRVTPINALLALLLFFVFGLFCFKILYLPKSADLLVKRNEYTMLTETANHYSGIDRVLSLTKGTAYEDVPLEDLDTLYTSYFEKLGGVKITRDNVTEYAIVSWDTPECEDNYKSMLPYDYESTLESGTLTIKINTFFYGLSSKVFQDLEKYKGQFHTFVYDLSDCSGGYIDQLVYVSDPIFPVSTIAKVKTNPNRKQINTLVYATSNFLVDADIQIIVNEGTRNFGELLALNASLQGYTVSGNTTSGDDVVYSMVYMEDTHSYYAYPVGQIVGMRNSTFGKEIN